jgi:hypothetical protein
MQEKLIMNEVGKYKNSSKLKIIIMIFIYKLLRFCNSDMFYFIYSLSITLVPLFIFDFNILTLFFGMFFHYLIFMFFLKDLIDEKLGTKKELYEIDKIIDTLKKYLKNKNPN